jgi:hypothetical protein
MLEWEHLLCTNIAKIINSLTAFDGSFPYESKTKSEKKFHLGGGGVSYNIKRIYGFMQIGVGY